MRFSTARISEREDVFHSVEEVAIQQHCRLAMDCFLQATTVERIARLLSRRQQQDGDQRESETC